MKDVIKRFLRLFLGYWVCAFGIVMTLNANLGVAPWDVLHQGIAKVLSLPIGKATIVLGFIIIILNIVFGENIGWGTVFNMIFIGIFIDILMLNNIIPVFNSFIMSFIMMLVGMLVLGYGCFLYIGAGLGTGPRDGVMVALTKRTGKSVRFVKNSVEILAIIAGYLLGGTIGIGTAVMAIAGGYFFQFAFKSVNFDVTAVKHRYIVDDIRYIKEKIEDYKIHKEET